MSGSSICLDIDDQTQVGAARRTAVALGQHHGLGEEAVGRLAIVVTEAATNIVRHAGRGAVILRALAGGGVCAVEVLALDKGPGIYAVERARQDGYSTTGTAGEGLGAMERLANVFDIHSQPGIGTAVLARVGARAASSRRSPESPDDRVGAVCAALRGQVECGDSWQIVVGRERLAVMVVDGLGHGPEAAAAATAAVTAFPGIANGFPEDTLAGLDAPMRRTRGAAVSVAMVDEGSTRAVRFSGVGNVDGRVLAGRRTEYLVPQNGIVGYTTQKLRSTAASWPASARLVMHSDGIHPRWRLDAYNGLLSAHPGLLAGVIYRDFARSRDDATILVVGPAATAPQPGSP